MKDKMPYMKTVNGQSLWFIEGDKPFGMVGTTVVDSGGNKQRGKLSIASFEEMDVAAYEVEPRLKEELKLTGITLTDKPENFGLPDYGQSHWTPLWELINELKIPIDFHIGAGLKTFVLEDFSWGSFGPQRKLASIAKLMYMSNAY